MASLEVFERNANRVQQRVDPASDPPQAGEAGPGDGVAEQRRREHGPGDAPPPVLAQSNVVPAVEELEQLVAREAPLEVGPVVLERERYGDERGAARPEHALELRDGVARISHPLEGLDAHDEVERLVRERNEVVRDDIGDAVRVSLDIEPNRPRTRGKQVVIWAGSAPHVEHVANRAIDALERCLEVSNEVPDVEIIELSPPRPPPRATNGGKLSG